MPVTFRSKAHEDVTMVRRDAARLLEIMGASGAVPSALGAQDIPDALRRLKAAISAEAADREADEAEDERGEEDDEEERPVSLRLRAWPLVRMLEASAARDVPVMWEG